MPKPEEVPKKNKTFLLKPEDVPKKHTHTKKKKKDFLVLEAPRPEDRKILFVFFLCVFLGTSSGFGNIFVFLVPPQALAIKSCQNLRGYQKNTQKKEKSFSCLGGHQA